MNIPPQISYAFGALLIVIGGLRAYFWGWKKRQAPLPPSEDGEVAPRRQDDETKRHLRYGVVWVLLGLFLLVSTTISRFRAG